MIYRIPLSLQDLPLISLDLAIELELAATTSARMTASHAPPTRYLHISHFSLLSTSECLGQWVSYQRDGDRGSRSRIEEEVAEYFIPGDDPLPSVA